MNESEGIEHLVHELNIFVPNNLPNAEVIFIDDGSTDDTLLKLKSAELAFDCRVIKLSKNYGSHAALRAGLLNAKGQYITFMYADLQDPLNLILQLHQKAEEGNDIVWANRNQTQSGVFSMVYSILMQKFVSGNYPSQGFDVVMFSNKVQEALNKNIESNSSIFLQILQLGYNQAFISYDKLPRKLGKSKWTFTKKVKLFIDSFVAFSYFPIRLVSIIGILMFFVGAVFATYLIYRKLAFNDLESGWPALVSILAIGFGVTNISLGILAEYLWRTLDASRKRPVFIIDDIIQLDNEQNKK